MADFLSKITKFLIPEEVEEIEAKVDEKQETRRQTVKVAPNVTRVANGPSIYTNTAEATRDEATSSATNNYEENNRRPSLKVYTQPNMNVLVFEPTNFNDTRIAADALKASKAEICCCNLITSLFTCSSDTSRCLASLIQSSINISQIVCGLSGKLTCLYLIAYTRC